MESPLLSFVNSESSSSNLFLGLEWPSLMPSSFNFSNNQQDQHQILENQIINDDEVVFVINNKTDHVLNSNNMLIENGFNNLIEHNTEQDDVVIDPDLLTLRSTPRCNDNNNSSI